MKKFLERFFLVFAFVSTMSLISCGDDDDEGGNGSSGIYGTWVSTLDDGEGVTVTFAKNSMKLQWANESSSETEIYDSFNYDESTHQITAHHCKTIYVYQGGSSESVEDDYVNCYVNWVDKNHITLGDRPGEVWEDYGTLTRQ